MPGNTIQRVGRTGVRIRDLGQANTPDDSCAGVATPMRLRAPLRHVVNAAIDNPSSKPDHQLGVNAALVAAVSNTN
jgi:hypothetical protein